MRCGIVAVSHPSGLETNFLADDERGRMGLWVRMPGNDGLLHGWADTWGHVTRTMRSVRKCTIHILQASVFEPDVQKTLTEPSHHTHLPTFHIACSSIVNPTCCNGWVRWLLGIIVL